MNYYLSNGKYRLPFPFATHVAATAHNATLGGGYRVVAVAERVLSGDDFEELELDQTELDAEFRLQELWGERWGE